MRCLSARRHLDEVEDDESLDFALPTSSVLSVELSVLSVKTPADTADTK